MSDTPFNGNPETIRTGTLGLPLKNNYLFNSSANIAPNYHVGPRTYGANGYVPHPLSYTGQPGPAPAFDPFVTENTAYAGVTGLAPGQPAQLASPEHYYSIGGRTPGTF